MRIKTFNQVIVAVAIMLVGLVGCKKDETDTIKKDPIISWENPADITYGTLLSETQLNATADIAGTYIYSPVSGTKLEIGDNQSLTVEFTPNDTENYNVASKTVKINVKQAAATTVTDADGNVYHTVTIGTQVWMVENLKTTKFRNGDALTKANNDNDWLGGYSSWPLFCSYNYNDANATAFGYLYNLKVVTDTRNIAPQGWHVASEADWETLITYLGGWQTAGGALKLNASNSTWTWTSPNVGASNSTGFSGLPAGFRTNTGFTGINELTWFAAGSTKLKTLAFSNQSVGEQVFADYLAISIRCVKD